MCISPHHKRLSNGTEVDIPCGYCYQCIRQKKLEWQIRLDAARNWSDCSFFRLLSYDEEHYNFDIHDKEVIYSHVKPFLKRLNERLKYVFPGITFKYFVASEYGEDKGRLHYHCLFFIKGAELTWFEMSKFINDAWPYGIVGNTFPLTSKNIAYCVKYIQKQYNVKFYSRFSMREVAPDLERRIKLNYSVDDYDSLPAYVLNGKKVGLPRYWRRQLLSQAETYAYRRTLDEHARQESLTEYENRLKKEFRLNANFHNKAGLDMLKKPVFRFPDNSDLIAKDYESDFQSHDCDEKAVTKQV